MSQTALPTELLEQLSDPYAILGISLTVDERSMLRRYHVLAKLLHPDRYTNSNQADQKLATAILTRLINPAYAELKNTQKRAEIVTDLRLKAITWGKSATSEQNPLTRKLIKMSIQEAQSFYEEAIASYNTIQYQSLTQSYWLVQKLHKLNLAYLYLQTQQSFIPPSDTSHTVVVPDVKHQSVALKLHKTQNHQPSINYAQRHYQRAVDYFKQELWALAVRELRDAIKLEPNNSDYYTLLGIVHLKQKFIGTAKVYIRHALKLNPQNPVALKYGHHLKLNLHYQTDPSSLAKAVGIAAWLNKFLYKADTSLSQVLKLR